MSQYPSGGLSKLEIEAENKPSSSDIFNGARCKSYSWSQSHDELEIHIKLPKDITQKQIHVALSKREICVEITRDYGVQTIVKEKFEHHIDKTSACWLFDIDTFTLILYIDKYEEMWWKCLFLDEQINEAGPRNYTVLMDHLDEGSRMAIDKLITDQKKKLLSRDDQLSLA